MAFNPAPSAFISSWSVSSGAVHFPLISVAELDATVADGTTGDSKQVIHRLMAHLNTWYQTLPAEEKPTNFKVEQSTRVVADVITRVYTVSIGMDIAESAFVAAAEA